MASQSGSEEKKPRRQTQTYESEGEESEEYQPRQRRRNQRQQRGLQGPLDNLALDNVQNTAGGLVNSATGVLGDVAGNAVQQQDKGGGKSDTLRLRLDLNLDIEITLKAKIHGDLELALLYVTLSARVPPLAPPPHHDSSFFRSIQRTQMQTLRWKYRRGSSVYSTSVSPPNTSHHFFNTLFVLTPSCLLPRLKVDVEKPEQEALSSLGTLVRIIILCPGRGMGLMMMLSFAAVVIVVFALGGSLGLSTGMGANSLETEATRAHPKERADSGRRSGLRRRAGMQVAGGMRVVFVLVFVAVLVVFVHVGWRTGMRCS